MKISSLRARWWIRFLLGAWGGFVYFWASLFWLVVALKNFGDLSTGVSILVSSLLCGYLSLFLGSWSAISGIRFIRSKPILIRITAWASLWASLEAIREYLFTGFTWGELGYHFSFWPSIAQSAGVWGVHGLTFFWIIFISLLLHVDEWWRHPRRRVGVAIASLFFILICFFSHLSIHSSAGHEVKKIALIQPNIDQSLKWESNRAREHLESLIELTQKAAREQPDLDLIVWPETSYPFLVAIGQKQLPVSSSIPLIVGAVVSDRLTNRNSALLIDGDRIVQDYSKDHLVPFGEFVPFEDWLPFKKLVANAGRFVSGGNSQPIMTLPNDSLKFGVLICYEDIFSRHSVKQARKGAQLLLNITNDAWYAKSSALSQHAAIAKMQSYQTQLPMVRATNTGLTTSFDLFDYSEIETHTRVAKIVEIKVPTSQNQSLFVRTYPLMQWIWILLFAIALAWPRQSETKKIFFRR